jgi:hypothetical protein
VYQKREVDMQRRKFKPEFKPEKVSAESQRVSELERLVGKLTLELEASKKLSSYFPSQ